MRDLAGNSLEFTGIDLLNTKFQLFNFKYQEVSSDLPTRSGGHGPASYRIASIGMIHFFSHRRR